MTCSGMRIDCILQYHTEACFGCTLVNGPLVNLRVFGLRRI
jgi:hypothetical protein